MITRTVRIQLAAFLALTMVGVSLVGARYVGLGARLFGGTYVVHADFAEAGGIFEGAEVTYRGVAVGRVGALVPTSSGVRVELVLDDETKVPADTLAVVANRSAIGEQYVDLRPRRRGPPYLEEGSTIPRAATRTPLSTTRLLVDLDRLVASVPRRDLVTVIDELGAAFAGSGGDLTRLIDAGDALVEAADANLRDTVALLEDGRTVLHTQRESSSAIKSFAADLADLSDTLVEADGDLRTVLDEGVVTARQLRALVEENADDVPVLLANLVTTGQIVRVRLKGLQQVLILYPYVIRGGYTVIAPDPKTGRYTAHFGLQLSLTPRACRKGYGQTAKRTPEDVEPTPPNTDARCADATTTMRGAHNAPGARGAKRPSSRDSDERSAHAGGDARRPGARGLTGGQTKRLEGSPTSSAPGSVATPTPERGTAGPTVAEYDPSSGLFRLPDGRSALLGSLGGQRRMFGEDSWKWLLIGPLSG
jgi:phospholipid/cholesterol/gamma-HCH transport system substrate-binding protein